MTSIKQIKKETIKQVDAILSNSGTRLEEMSNVLKIHFGSTKLSEIGATYESAIASQPEGKNASLAPAVESYQDLISVTIDEIQTLDRYIMLHTPQMEDGNNFGVTVQMMVSKALTDSRDELTKMLAAVPAYNSARADAVEKLGMQRTVTTGTKTTSNSESTGGKDGDDKKTSSSTVCEEKMVGPAGVEERMTLRLVHVASLDVQFYFQLRSGLLQCRDTYLMILDNVEKNKSKLTLPKGTGGSNSMNMY